MEKMTTLTFPDGSTYEITDAEARRIASQLSPAVGRNTDDINVLTSRVNNFTKLKEGSTTGDAELIDGRTDYKGDTWSNIGNHIRGVTSQLSSDIEEKTSELKETLVNETVHKTVNRNDLLRDEYKVDEKYRQYTDGALLSNADYTCFDMIPIESDKVYYTPYVANVHICFFDSNKSYISGFEKTGVKNTEFTTPSNACYMSYSVNLTNYPNACLYSGFVYYGEESGDLYIDNILGLNNALNKVCGANLFNKNAVLNGKYIDENNGGLPSLSSYCVYFVPTKASTKYTCIGVNLTSRAFYDVDGNYISATDGKGTTTTPSNCKYLGVSIEISNIDNVVICEGETAIWSEFGSGAVYNTMNVIEVGADSTFKTIQSAVDFAKDGDIIYIHNGTYHESVKNRYKYLHFLGESKEKCIIEYDNGNYANPPLEIAKGSIKNLTIHCISQELQSGAIAKAYCIHTDWGTSKNSNLYCENVRFYNDDNQVVGIGLQTNFTLEFVNCEFVTDGNTNAFYCHTEDSEGAGANQKLVVRNCTMVNNGTEYTIHMQSQEETNAYAECIWQRNIVVNKASDKLVDMVIYDNGLSKDNWLGSTDWHNSVLSALNNIEQLNYATN